MFFFSSRSASRTFAGKVSRYKAVDMGKDAPDGKRWAVKVTK